jgi:hypothetical protein
MMRRPDVIEDGALRRLGRILVDQAIPAGLAAGLHLAQRTGHIALVPLNVVIERQYGPYAVFLSAIAAFVAAAAFSRAGRRFGIVAFLCTALVSILMASPFLLARYGMDLGLTPMQFSVVATYAYLGFAITIGLLIGGCWSLVIRTLRDPGPAGC